MSEILIRKYRPGEETILRKLFFDTIRNINIKDYSKEQVLAWAPEDYDKNDWSQRIRSTNPFVALIGNKIVGFADIQDDGYIDHFFCHWQHQGEGIGKMLMQTLVHEGEKEGFKQFYSNVSITAKPFFERFGFRVLKKQEVNIRGQKLINFIMERMI